MEISYDELIPKPIPESLIKTSQVWSQSNKINSGDRVLIYAESGKGKTTLINIILGIRKDYEGELLIDNKDIKSFSPKDLVDLRKKVFSVVPQGLALFDDLTVLENINLKNNICNKFEQHEIAELLAELGIDSLQNNKVKYLSFGQKQRLSIARALCQDFKFILLDEPFSHLDVNNQNIAIEIIKRHADKQNAGIIITSLDENINFNFNQKLKV